MGIAGDIPTKLSIAIHNLFRSLVEETLIQIINKNKSLSKSFFELVLFESRRKESNLRPCDPKVVEDIFMPFLVNLVLSF